MDRFITFLKKLFYLSLSFRKCFFYGILSNYQKRSGNKKKKHFYQWIPKLATKVNLSELHNLLVNSLYTISVVNDKRRCNVRYVCFSKSLRIVLFGTRNCSSVEYANVNTTITDFIRELITVHQVSRVSYQFSALFNKICITL